MTSELISVELPGNCPFATMRNLKKYMNAKLWQISSHLGASLTQNNPYDAICRPKATMWSGPIFNAHCYE